MQFFLPHKMETLVVGITLSCILILNILFERFYFFLYFVSVVFKNSWMRKWICNTRWLFIKVINVENFPNKKKSIDLECWLRNKLLDTDSYALYSTVIEIFIMCYRKEKFNFVGRLSTFVCIFYSNSFSRRLSSIESYN